MIYFVWNLYKFIFLLLKDWIYYCVMLSRTLRIDKSDNYHLIDDYLDNYKQKRNSLNFHHLLPYFNKITMILAISPLSPLSSRIVVISKNDPYHFIFPQLSFLSAFFGNFYCQISISNSYLDLCLFFLFIERSLFSIQLKNESKPSWIYFWYFWIE